MHMTCLVVGDVDTQMAPYQENNMGDCPEEYLSISEEMTNTDAKKEFEKTPKHKGDTIEDYMDKQYGYVFDKENEWWGYLGNENAKWDWYEIGGRWKNELLFTDGTRGDGAEKSEVDFRGMKEDKLQEAEKIWNEYMKESHKIERVVSDRELRDKLGISERETKKEFLDRDTSFKCYSFLDSSGDWHDDITQEQFDKLLAEVLDDEYITVVDYHM
jgi:hypothetical protein